MDGGVVRVTLQVRHDCPVARLSAEYPLLQIQTWSGHRVEMVHAQLPGGTSEEVEAMLEPFISPQGVFPSPNGVMAVWHPKAAPQASLTRRLEAHGMLWLQPLHVEAGWERYEVLAFSDGAEQAALDDLRASHEVRVIRREAVSPDEVAGALFLSLQPTIGAPTHKQAEALVAAYDEGYYRSPRGSTTARVAAKLGLGRSAFEERLRNAENHVMARVVPAMRQRRLSK